MGASVVDPGTYTALPVSAWSPLARFDAVVTHGAGNTWTSCTLLDTDILAGPQGQNVV